MPLSIDPPGYFRLATGRDGQKAIHLKGRWNLAGLAAIDAAVPAPVLTTALYERFASRGEAEFQNRLLSAMRFGFGGHLEKHGDA